MKYCIIKGNLFQTHFFEGGFIFMQDLIVKNVDVMGDSIKAAKDGGGCR